MGIRGSTERALEKLAYRYYLKNTSRSSEENWNLAIRLLEKLKVRKIREYLRKQNKFLLANGIIIFLILVSVIWII